MNDERGRLRRVAMAAVAWPLLAGSLGAAPLDLHQAAIVISPRASVPERKAAQMLAGEIEKRTQLRLPVRTGPVQGPAFVLGRVGQMPAAAGDGRGAPDKPEGFSLRTSTGGASPVAVVTGYDDRGVVFGTGYLLRHLEMGRQRLQLASGLDVTSAPQVAVRGHQLGYRPKTNTYDAWDVRRWEQYIRELAIFGVNTIELIPPHSDDAPDSPHFPLPPMEMMVEMSRIADEYGLNVSIWYPAMDPDYSDPGAVAKALREWGEVFRRLPRVDAVFVPGGDPGHTEPKVLMALLEKQAANLRRYHPKAQMWVSPQSFPKPWMDEFFSLLDTQPAWLTGVVYGPQQMYSLPELRERIPRRYPIRFYPDITHSLHAQFPVPDWDAAFALTEGREVINPRPMGEAAIFRWGAPYTTGFVTYSEGSNDDVNKFVWSGLGWNPRADPRDILREYAGFFIGGDAAEGFAAGLLDLERNWSGPLLSNHAVDATLLEFQNLERRATPQMRANWRFQQALYRAYYDALVRDRLRGETEQEARALEQLRGARRSGALAAVRAAQDALDQDTLTPRAAALRARVFELGEALFQSIGMQLSVPRYQAIAVDRGANLDTIDSALNDRAWLKARFAEIRATAQETGRLRRIDAVVNWTNPGPGGFYDDLGDPRRQPHLVRGDTFDRDPEFRGSPLPGFGAGRPDQGWRMSWFRDAESLFDEPLRMRYTGLDPGATYKVRVVYGGDMPRIPIRLVANGTMEIHGFLAKPAPIAPLEFPIPREATRGGTLLLEWTRPPGIGGNGRGCQVSEVWLIRATPGP